MNAFQDKNQPHYPESQWRRAGDGTKDTVLQQQEEKFCPSAEALQCMGSPADPANVLTFKEQVGV